MSRLTKSVLLVFLVLLVDQVVKILIKTNMYLGQEFSVFGDWFLIHFVENNGMAFGIEFAGEYGKMFLSLFRIVAVIGIGWYLLKLIKNKEVPMGFIACVSLIFAGAIGNIIDSAFYGLFSMKAMVRWRSCFLQRRLFLIPAWEGGRYALFSSFLRTLSRLVTILGRRILVFPSGI